MRRLRDPREGKQHLQPSPGGRARVYTHTHRPADPLPRPLAEPTCPVSGSLPAGHIPPTRAGLHEGRRELPHLLCRHRLTPPHLLSQPPGRPPAASGDWRLPLVPHGGRSAAVTSAQFLLSSPIPGASGDPGALSQLQLLSCVRTARIPRGSGQPSPPRRGCPRQGSSPAYRQEGPSLGTAQVAENFRTKRFPFFQ